MKCGADLVMLTILDAAKSILPPTTRARLKQWRLAERIYDWAVINRTFRRVYGRRPNLRRPVTYNEKIAYKMLFDRRPVLTKIADKVKARDYVADRVGAHFLSTLYQVCDSVEGIDWQCLPQGFAIKMNHGSKMNILVYDKSTLDIERTTAQLRAWHGRNFYHHLREWCYRDIRPMIMFEELLHGVPGQRPVEWKFFVFNGRTAYVEISCGPDGDRKKTLFDRDLKRVSARWIKFPTMPEDPAFPGNIGEMISTAEVLARGLDFVRVDLYNVDGRIVFGELTNYPAAGRLPLVPAEYDEVMGQHWECPRRYE